jgi:hypothetical protein
MEITCNRCHQTVQADSCYCPACGLPQLLYTAEGLPGQIPADQWTEPVRDAATIEWKSALRAAVLLAVPAGLLCSTISPLDKLGLVWMTTAAGAAVMLYVRSQQARWITIGAGSRIGLVTGLLAGWLAFFASGGDFFVKRFLLHQADQVDGAWRAQMDLNDQLASQYFSMDATQMRLQRAWMMSPWGHAGYAAFGAAFSALFLVFFAVAGGALGARLLARRQRPEI